MSRPTRPAGRTLLTGLVAALTLFATPAASLAVGDTAVSAHALYGVKVPGMCGHSGGRLVNGVLPGIPDMNGFVALAAAEGAKHQVVLGKFRSGDHRDAAAGFECNQGGVAWPEYLQVYGPGMKRIGGIDLVDVLRGEEVYIYGLSTHHNAIDVKLILGQKSDDPDGDGSVSAYVVLKTRRGSSHLTVVRNTHYTEVASTKKLIAAVNAGSRTRALKYATKSAVEQLFSWGNESTLGVSSCHGELSEYWPETVDLSESRICLISVHSGSTVGELGLYMQRSHWRTWRGVRVDYRGCSKDC